MLPLHRRSRGNATIILTLLSFAPVLACETPSEPGEAQGIKPRPLKETKNSKAPPPGQQNMPTASKTPARGPRLIPAPEGDVVSIAMDLRKAGQNNNEKLLVYVGAPWCEPCQVFHRAIESGELDKALAGVNFLEFNLDRDRERLREAGYQSRLIPLFALIGPDGKAAGPMVEGSVKGPKAVANILPRLKKLLQRNES